MEKLLKYLPFFGPVYTTPFVLEELVSRIMTHEYDESVPGFQPQKQTHDEQNETNLGGRTERHVIYSFIIFPKPQVPPGSECLDDARNLLTLLNKTRLVRLDLHETQGLRLSSVLFKRVGRAHRRFHERPFDVKVGNHGPTDHLVI